MRQQRKMSPFAILSTPLLMLALAVSFGIGVPIRADAASKGVSQSKVLAACKRTAGCWSRNEGAGTRIGCSPHACFVCTGGKCFADMRGKPPGNGATIGGIRLPPGTVQPSSGGKGNGNTIRHPVNVGVRNGPTQVKTPIAGGQGGGTHHGGRGR